MISISFFDLILNMKKNTLLKLSILISFLAILTHLYLTQHYFDVKVGQVDGKSLCNISETFNCDSVSASPYSAFLGIPVALYGALTHLVLLLLTIITLTEMTDSLKQTQRWAIRLSLLIAAASVGMGFISMSFLGQFCLFCIFAYILSFINAGLLLKIENPFPECLSDLKKLFSEQKWILGLFIAIPAFAFFINFNLNEKYGLDKINIIAQEKIAAWKLAPVQNFDPLIGMTISAKTTPVMTIVEFADYRCPHCKHANQVLHAFLETHPDVTLVFKPYPLDGVCNKALNGGDGVSCDYAYLTFCAEKLANKGWLAHDYIFENQNEFRQVSKVASVLNMFETQLKIPQSDLAACMSSEETKLIIQKSSEEGNLAKIQGTPTIFVNGKLLEGGQILPILESAYKDLKYR